MAVSASLISLVFQMLCLIGWAPAMTLFCYAYSFRFDRIQSSRDFFMISSVMVSSALEQNKNSGWEFVASCERRKSHFKSNDLRIGICLIRGYLWVSSSNYVCKLQVASKNHHNHQTGSKIFSYYFTQLYFGTASSLICQAKRIIQSGCK